MPDVTVETETDAATDLESGELDPTTMDADVGSGMTELEAQETPPWREAVEEVSAEGEEGRMSSDDTQHPSTFPSTPPWIEVDQPAAVSEEESLANAASQPPRRQRGANATRPLFDHEQRASEQEFWDTTSMIAQTGRHPVPRPKSKTLPLNPPQRFRPPRRWVSALALSIVVVAIFITIIGVLQIEHYGSDILRQFAPTPQPTRTLAPTANPIPTITPLPKTHKK